VIPAKHHQHKEDPAEFEEDCLTLLKKLTNYFIQNQETVFKIFKHSGKDYNDFGSFQRCEAIGGYKYLLGTISPEKRLSNPISIGLCMPEVC